MIYEFEITYKGTVEGNPKAMDEVGMSEEDEARDSVRISFKADPMYGVRFNAPTITLRPKEG